MVETQFQTIQRFLRKVATLSEDLIQCNWELIPDRRHTYRETKFACSELLLGTKSCLVPDDLGVLVVTEDCEGQGNVERTG